MIKVNARMGTEENRQNQIRLEFKIHLIFKYALNTVIFELFRILKHFCRSSFLISFKFQFIFFVKRKKTRLFFLLPHLALHDHKFYGVLVILQGYV